MIPLHIPYFEKHKQNLLGRVLDRNDNVYSKLEKKVNDFGYSNTFFTKSCTNALEVVALLLDIKNNDEIIVPSYTYVSTANAFALFGANIVFADSLPNHPNVDVDSILKLITKKTKAIVVMHYGSIPVPDSKKLKRICDSKKIFLIEDAAHCIGARLDNTLLGKNAHASVFSFHESKNLTCVEGGMIVINHKPWLKRAENILYKGTNRAAFDRKSTSVYEWVDKGSSFKMDTLHAAILEQQFNVLEKINSKRLKLFNLYIKNLLPLKKQGLIDFYEPLKSEYHNGHIFWIVLKNEKQRKSIMQFLLKRGIFSTFHYLALHKSPFGKRFKSSKTMNNAIKFEKCLLRLPLYYQLNKNQVDEICTSVKDYFKQ